MFADDTKIASQVNTLNDLTSMQRPLDKLVAWVNRWEMDFNVNKCEKCRGNIKNVVLVEKLKNQCP